MDYKVEEVDKLEPIHRGFAIRGITSFTIAPTKRYSFKSFKNKKLDDLFLGIMVESNGFEPSEAFSSPVSKTNDVYLISYFWNRFYKWKACSKKS